MRLENEQAGEDYQQAAQAAGMKEADEFA